MFFSCVNNVRSMGKNKISIRSFYAVFRFGIKASYTDVFCCVRLFSLSCGFVVKIKMYICAIYVIYISFRI